MERWRRCRQSAELARGSICRAGEGALHCWPGGGRECGGNEAADHGQHYLPKARVIGNGARVTPIAESKGRYRDSARRLAARRHRQRREHGLGVERIALVWRSGDHAPLLWDWQAGDHRRRRRRSARAVRAHRGAASVRRWRVVPSRMRARPLSSSGKEARAAQARMRWRWDKAGRRITASRRPHGRSDWRRAGRRHRRRHRRDRRAEAVALVRRPAITHCR